MKPRQECPLISERDLRLDAYGERDAFVRRALEERLRRHRSDGCTEKVCECVRAEVFLHTDKRNSLALIGWIPVKGDGWRRRKWRLR